MMISFEINSFPFLTAVVISILTAYFLNIHSRPTQPKLHFLRSELNLKILQKCEVLLQKYIPTFIWGKSGHIQTFLYGKMGRVQVPKVKGDRHSVVMKDGATMTFDVFQPLQQDDKKCVLVVCPGIANSSESLYIRTLIDFAQKSGYCLAVLNHLGSVANIALTAPRIYTYGDTEEYGVMVARVSQLLPNHQFIAVGFSMGANVVIKYLGEKQDRQKRFQGAISFCQGYDIIKLCPRMKEWTQMRRVYTLAMTRHQQGILRRWREALFNDEACRLSGGVDFASLMNATTLHQIDELYSHRRAGFQSCSQYYEWASSSNYIDQVKLPMLLLNAEDDPIVPSEMWNVPYRIAYEHDNVIFATTRHGGHLGFFEGGLFYPNSITWLDRVIVSYSDALLNALLTTASTASTASTIGWDVKSINNH